MTHQILCSKYFSEIIVKKFEKKPIFFSYHHYFFRLLSIILSQIYTRKNQVPDLKSVTPVKPFEATRFVPIHLRKQLLI